MNIFRPNVEKLMNKRDVMKLIKLLDNYKDPETQCKAAEALGKIGDVQAVAPLIDALNSFALPISIAETFSKIIGVESTLEETISELKGTNLRWAAAEALGAIGDARAVNPLIAALKEEDKAMRVAAAEALGTIADLLAVVSLCAALKDECDLVRETAGEALLKIADAHQLTVEDMLEASMRD